MVQVPNKENTAHFDEEMVQLVISHVAEQDFAAKIQQVSEVLRNIPVTPIPDAPGFIKGIASFHGEMAVVIDLQRYFSLSEQPNDDAKHIIVIRHEQELYGLLVNEVTRIIRVPESSIKQAPELINQMNCNYIEGVHIENEENLIMVFNLDAILSDNDLLMIKEIKQTANNSPSKPGEK